MGQTMRVSKPLSDPGDSCNLEVHTEPVFDWCHPLMLVEMSKRKPGGNYQLVFGAVLPFGGCQYETFFQFRCSSKTL